MGARALRRAGVEPARARRAGAALAHGMQHGLRRDARPDARLRRMGRAGQRRVGARPLRHPDLERDRPARHAAEPAREVRGDLRPDQRPHGDLRRRRLGPAGRAVGADALGHAGVDPARAHWHRPHRAPRRGRGVRFARPPHAGLRRRYRRLQRQQRHLRARAQRPAGLEAARRRHEAPARALRPRDGLRPRELPAGDPRRMLLAHGRRVGAAARPHHRGARIAGERARRAGPRRAGVVREPARWRGEHLPARAGR